MTKITKLDPETIHLLQRLQEREGKIPPEQLQINQPPPTTQPQPQPNVVNDDAIRKSGRPRIHADLSHLPDNEYKIMANRRAVQRNRQKIREQAEPFLLPKNISSTVKIEELTHTPSPELIAALQDWQRVSAEREEGIKSFKRWLELTNKACDLAEKLFRVLLERDTI